MTKSDIIREYNNLLKDLKDALNDYVKVTGESFRCSYNIFLDELPASCMIERKDVLENRLNSRIKTIAEIKKRTEIHINLEKLKSTKVGMDFIKNYEDEKTSLLGEIDKVSEHLENEMNRLLANIGMGDWKLQTKNPIPSEYGRSFEIQNQNNNDAVISISIYRENGKWEIESNSSVHLKRHLISNKDEQYEQYKGVVKIYDNSDIVQKWVETAYEDMVRKIHRIKVELDNVEESLKDPYKKYVETFGEI